MSVRNRTVNADSAIVSDRGTVNDNIDIAWLQSCLHQALEVLKCLIGLKPGDGAERALPKLPGEKINRVTW